MNKLLPLLACALLWASVYVMGQTPFNTEASLDINNINAGILVHGDLFTNPVTQKPHCEFPKGSGKHTNASCGLWLSGYDGSGQLHTAAQMYRHNGIDYWPGPLDASDTLTYSTSYNWAKIWKINRTDIQYFQSMGMHTIANTPEAILTWPAKGNTYARGNAFAPLTITTDLAPFVDLNSNGVYEPLSGEYPDIRGDQAAWWIFSDNGPTHSTSKGKPLGVEVHAMAYAYKRGTLIDNVVYFDYLMVNKSGNNYHGLRAGLFDDADLGYYLDDYIGFDSTWRMGITYNALNDDGVGVAHPINSYGKNIPITGLTMVALPGDAGTSYVPAGSFIITNNDGSISGTPTTDTQFNHLMHAHTALGIQYTNTFQGPGQPCSDTGTGPATNYVYTGDPNDPAEWSMCRCSGMHVFPNDIRFIMTSNDFTLNAGSTAHMVAAMVTTDPDTNNYCPTANFQQIRIAADTAWRNYHNPPAPLPPNGIGVITADKVVHVYPSPAKDRLYVECGMSNAEATAIVYNTLGQRMNVVVSKQGKKYEVDISGLPAGLYSVVYWSGEEVGTARFVKE